MGLGKIYVTTSNDCGISPRLVTPVNVTIGGVQYAISPNPATSVITVEQLTTEEADTCSVLTPVSVFESSSVKITRGETYTVEIWHEKKGIIKAIKSKKRVSIDASELDKGDYFLHIITPTTFYEEHIMIE